MSVALGVLAQGYKHYTIEQGLPSNRIYKILQDNEGFMWIATDKGLSRFDGSFFKNFTIRDGLPSNDIWNIEITNDNKIWFFTRSNRLGYIFKDTIYNFSAPDQAFFYPSVVVNDKVNIGFKSYGNNYRLINGQWEVVDTSGAPFPFTEKVRLLHNKIKYIQVDNRLKNPFYNSLIYLIFDTKNRLVTKIDNAIGVHSNIKGQINDSLFVFNIENGLKFFNLNRLTEHNLINPDLFQNYNFVRVLATGNDIQISSKNYWAQLGSDYQLQGLHFFNPNLHLINVFKDRQGNFWGMTYAKGIYFFPKNSLASKSYLSQHPVQFLKKIKGHVFAGVINEGIFKYDAVTDRFKPFFKAQDYFFDLLYFDDDYFTVLANNKMYSRRFDRLDSLHRLGKGAVNFQSGYAVREMDAVFVYDKHFKLLKKFPVVGSNALISVKNSLIAGSPVGLFLIEKDSVQRINIAHKRDFPVVSLAKIGTSIIVGTDGYGAYLWLNKDKFIFMPETKDLIVNHIHVDADRFWLATHKGVMAYKYTGGKLHFEKILRKTDGLISDHVNHVLTYNQHLFTSNFSGVLSVPLNQEEIFPIQKIYFKSIFYNQEPVNNLSHEVNYVNDNKLVLNFGLIDYSGQEHNQYFFRLLPLQKKWVEIHSKSVNFNNLKPNNYTFQIKVTNPYRQELVKAYHFKIKPLWWQKSWAKLLFVLTGLSSLFLIGYYTRKKELQKQRNKLIAEKQMAEFELHALRSQMNPHFVFNSLNAILYYINDENFDKSETYLIRFSRLIRMIFEFSRKKTIKLKQEIALLKSYLNLEKMRFGDDFNYCFDIDPKLDIDQVEIPTLLLQPIVENAVNHGIFHKNGRGTICLSFTKLDTNTFEVKIMDDGVGIKRSREINEKSLKKHQSRSTQILQDRIKLLNKSGQWRILYQIEDLTGSDAKFNTIVTLKITKL